ncbi:MULTISPECIES: cytochrome o ubiquinol oxidase subunit IV [Agrobacterium]|jgi:cytochrome o ubiquinol oxidase operon protein cyoD|uniref:Cytochrome bo(3) ubiquinol oxidase subunit 4 n=2 Tax=Agrobacterium fabrum TaxID=1176649 RepID=Q7D245_AGRFC|nr:MULTISPECIES: cytochrome o ubiquinol oxidase subunit IV [Agrobacterium]KEY54563.1 cytochrome O ubiquinol oxidase [Agrobacterium tumefaciens]AAK85960.2 cytochrome o ubiquinol oxidase subunit IV [Agrobacterium fabrum str. C58]AYM58649.1 cytochrome o ubiquinol oxidase subunit IV [Agrobacterium fabrum]AYM63703.1 cytochrome o ubiquinol oxidase subunit IV [Agrobacterium fabrum]EGL66868.1 cytochrome O ubiquinol oxidase subunit IV [Agrobacterium sp. ATCC 31749]
MSSEAHAHHDAHGDDHHHDGASHGTFKSYMIGFVLSVILTAIPFWLVMGGVLENKTLLVIAIMGLGVIQIFVHMIYFLHMDTRSEGGWTFMALIFTVVVLLITLSGSLWVMYNMNKNMMPLHIEDVKNLP